MDRQAFDDANARLSITLEALRREPWFAAFREAQRSEQPELNISFDDPTYVSPAEVYAATRLDSARENLAKVVNGVTNRVDLVNLPSFVADQVVSEAANLLPGRSDTLQYLSIEVDALSSDGMNHLATALRDHPSIQTLLLRGNESGDEARTNRLFESFQTLPKLEVLMLVRWNVWPGDFLENLSTRASHLRRLELSLGPNQPADAAERIAAVWTTTFDLEELHLETTDHSIFYDFVCFTMQVAPFSTKLQYTPERYLQWGEARVTNGSFDAESFLIRLISDQCGPCLDELLSNETACQLARYFCLNPRHSLVPGPDGPPTLPPQEADRLASLLRRNLEALTSVKLTGWTFAERQVEMICQSLLMNEHVKCLELKGFGGLVAYRHVADLCRLSMALEKLILVACGFGAENGEAIRLFAQGMSENRSIALLDLKGTPMNAGHLSILAQGLLPSRVRSLYLARCEINQDGVHALVEAFRDGSLDLLDLSSNQFGDGGVLELALALQSNNLNVTHLILDSNDLSDDSLLALAWAFETNEMVCSVSINGCGPFGVRAVLALADSLPRMQGLRELSFSIDVQELATTSSLQAALFANKSLTRIIIQSWMPPSKYPKDWRHALEVIPLRNKGLQLFQRSTEWMKLRLAPYALSQLGQGLPPTALYAVFRSNHGALTDNRKSNGDRKRELETTVAS